MRRGERDAIRARLAVFGERMAVEGTLSGVEFKGREVTFVYCNGETEGVRHRVGAGVRRLPGG